MDALIALALLVLAALSLAMILGPPLLLVSRGAWARLPLALWVAAMVLLAVWVFVEVQAGVRADEEGTSGNIFAASAMAWWFAALLVGTAATASALRGPGTPSGPAAGLGVVGASVLVALAALVFLGPLLALVLLPLLLMASWLRVISSRRGGPVQPGRRFDNEPEA